MKETLVVLLGLFLISCKPESTATTEANIVEVSNYSLDMGDSNEAVDVTHLSKNFYSIGITPSVLKKITTLFHFTLLENGDAILVDEISDNVVRIDKRGEEIWNLSAKDNDFRYFQNIEDCTFDHFNKRIIISDDYDIYVFDFQGLPVNVPYKPKFDYHQMAVASSESLVFSAQGLINDFKVHKTGQLIWVSDGELRSTFIEHLLYAPKHTYISGFPEFSRLGSNLHYHATFRDTFHRIDLPDVYPDFTFRLNSGERLDEIMQDRRIENKFDYLRENGIPEPTFVAANEQKLLAVYRYNRNQYFAYLDRSTNEWLANHTILQYEDTYFRVPPVYQNGSLAWIISEEEMAHFQKLRETDGQINTKWKEELARLREADDDRGGKTLLLLEF